MFSYVLLFILNFCLVWRLLCSVYVFLVNLQVFEIYFEVFVICDNEGINDRVDKVWFSQFDSVNCFEVYFFF